MELLGQTKSQLGVQEPASTETSSSKSEQLVVEKDAEGNIVTVTTVTTSTSAASGGAKAKAQEVTTTVKKDVLPTDEEVEAKWGKPMGLPSPTPPKDNKPTK